MPKPDADPHGGSEDFEKVKNPYCDIPEIRDDLKKVMQMRCFIS